MSVTYMLTWTFLVIFAVGFGRLRDIRQMAGIVAITLLILVMSQTLAAELATTIRLDPSLIYTNPELFLGNGPVGWLALLVTPCGWLGPTIGLRLMSRRFEAEL